MTPRQLQKGEAQQFHALWLEGLTQFPSAFLLTEQEARATSTDQIEKSIAAGHHWGVWQDGALVALGSLRQGGLSRLRHTADIGPFYVAQNAQGQGIAKRLLHAMLNYAKAQKILQVELCVDTQNAAAIALYLGSGFEIFGTRPRSVMVDGIARDDHLMMCRLD